MNTKKLTSGIKKIRQEKYLYTDKAEYIHRRVTPGSLYSLSPPRRSGKSQATDTLKALSTGQKELFERLYIHDKWSRDRKYPVIRTDRTPLTGHTLSATGTRPQNPPSRTIN
jgi:hypothetical protein